MSRKKVIAIVLSFVMIASSISIITVSPALGSQIVTGIPIINNFSAQKQPDIVVENNTQPDLNKLKSTDKERMVIKLPAEDKTVYTGTIQSLSKDQNSNLFTYSQQDLEQLLANGYSIEDILKAGEIGNRIIEDPKKLLDRKNKEDKDWTTVEKEVNSEKELKYIDKMKAKYPDYYTEFIQENLSQSDMVKLFAHADQYKITTIDGLVKDYKAKGDKALSSDKAIKKQTISNERLNKLGLTSDDVKGLSEEMLDRLEIVSKKTNTPVKDLVKKMKESKTNGGVKQ